MLRDVSNIDLSAELFGANGRCQWDWAVGHGGLYARRGEAQAAPAPATSLTRRRRATPDVTAEQGAMGLNVAANLLAWPALKRKAYRLDPSFAS